MTSKSQVRTSPRAAKRRTVEQRIRLDATMRTKLRLAADARGIQVSALVIEALRPHLKFSLPKMPGLDEPETGLGCESGTVEECPEKG